MASRATLTLLPRRAPSTLLQTRPFSQSLLRLAKDDRGKAPIRHNPLVGNYRAPEPAPAASPADHPTHDSVSTEHPGATKTPSPDRAPVSSAEVAPNADLPPRPPPETASATSSVSAQYPPTQHPYDASRSPLRNTTPPPKRTSSTTLDFLSVLGTQKSVHDANKLDPLDRPKVRAKATSGRTVFVKNFIGVNSATSAPMAINVLNTMVSKQGIRSKAAYQKYHERRGMKKKRLRMQRWRVQFKQGFKETVKRVMELKRQGW